MHVVGNTLSCVGVACTQVLVALFCREVIDDLR
jgi:hypothetical protein